MRNIKILVLLLTITVTVLLFTGCQLRINTENLGLSCFTYDNAEYYSVGNAEIAETVEHIEIDWLTGNITVKPHNADTISFSEESASELTDATQLHYRLDGTTLYLQFCDSGRLPLNKLKKSLTVYIPQNLMLTGLNVNTVSSDICLEAIQLKNVSADTVSGSIRLINCAVTELADINMIGGMLEATFTKPLNEFQGSNTSGGLKISTPSITKFKADTVSGSISLASQTAPEVLNVDTTSGNIDLSLPEGASFILHYDSVSGDLFSDLPCKSNAGKYIFGDGKGDYEVDTVSGDIRITTEE